MDGPYQDLSNGIFYFVVAQIFVELWLFSWAISNLYMFKSESMNGKSFFASFISSAMLFAVAVERKVKSAILVHPNAPQDLKVRRPSGAFEIYAASRIENKLYVKKKLVFNLDTRVFPLERIW